MAQTGGEAQAGGAAKTASRRFFDVWSLTYDNPVVQAVTYRPVQDAVIRQLRRRSPAKVLDLGCGTGLFSSRLADALDVPVIGFDLSRGMLDRAARRSAVPAWVQGDAVHLPFAPAAVDAVVSTESFHWYPDQQRSLAELARVLAPGGVALLALINPPARVISTLTARWSRAVGQPLHWPTPGRLREMATGAGFVVDEQAPVLRLPVSALFPTVVTVLRRP